MSGLEDHGCAGPFAEPVIWQRHHRDLVYRGMAEHGGFDLRRHEGDATTTDDILAPAAVDQVPVGVQVSDVAGQVATPGRKRSAGQFLVAEEAEEPARAVDGDRSRLARRERTAVRIKDLDLGAGERPSLGLDHLLPRLGHGVRGVPGNLGEPVIG